MNRLTLIHHPEAIRAREALGRECRDDLATWIATAGGAAMRAPVPADGGTTHGQAAVRTDDALNPTDEALRATGRAAVSRDGQGALADVRGTFTDPGDMAAWIRAELRRGRTVILFPRKEPT